MSYYKEASSGGSSSVYSVAKQVFNNGALPPIVSPASVYPDANAWYSSAITSSDVDFATGDIVCLNAGTYKITVQFTFDKTPDPSQQNIQVNLGLTDVPPNPLVYENITFQHFDTNGVGQFSCEFQTVVEATAGQSFQIHFVLGGTAGANLSYFVGAEAGFILVERLA
jgi:hypothetical protein